MSVSQQHLLNKNNTIYMKVRLSKPHIDKNDINAVIKVLESGTLSLGPKLQEFKEIKEYHKKASNVQTASNKVQYIIYNLG